MSKAHRLIVKETNKLRRRLFSVVPAARQHFPASPLDSRKDVTTHPNKALTKQLKNTEHEHFFRYTSGRWLWDEEQQLRDRYKAFNVAELQSLAAKVIGSTGCASMIKLAEGDFNKVFRLTMDDGKQVLARIPNPNAGPPFYATASEVATMSLCRDLFQIPTPRVLAWSATPSNSVGSEYIIMEEAKGSQLSVVWDKLGADSKLAIMREIVAVETKLLSISFSHYGSVYFASDAVEGAVPCTLTDEAPSEMKKQMREKFCIGPIAERQFWNKERASMDISRGPWQSPGEYATCVGQREREWITKYAIPKPPSESGLYATGQNDPQAHLQLLDRYLKVAPTLVDLEHALTRPTLWHGDRHSSNILVEGNRITAIINWQGSWIGPLSLQAHPSPILNHSGKMILQQPDNFDDLGSDEQAEIEQSISKSTLHQLYLLETGQRNPVLAQAYHLEHGKTRRLPVALAGNTWDDDIVSFREALISVERYWHELGLQGECPYNFTQDELLAHSTDAEDWNRAQNFLDSIDGFVQRDGWTSPETYDDALQMFLELRHQVLDDEQMQGEERTSFEQQTRWAEGKD